MQSVTATSLRLRVRRGGATKADVTLPARSIENLEELVPEHLRAQVLEQGLDLRKISETAVQSGYETGPVLALDTNDTNVRIWLE